MISMCFDLSSTCIGVTFAQTRDGVPVYVKTLAIIPNPPTGKTVGYTTKEPKKVDYNGSTFKTYLKPGEHFTSKAEAERRIKRFKAFKHKELLRNVGKQCGFYLKSIHPDVIAIERNESFNGVLTTKLLAEIAGGIYFYAGANDIEMFDYNVNTVRAEIRKDIPEFDYPDDKIALDSKYEIYCRLKSYFDKHHPGMIDFSEMTLDESDSLAVFYKLKKEKIDSRHGRTKE